MQRLQSGLLAAVLILSAGLAPADAFAAPEPGPELELRDIVYTESRGEESALVVRAERARLDPGQEQVQLEALRVRLAPRGQGTSLEMTCQRGQLDLARRAFELRGDVRGKTADGRRFRTAWLRYDPERDVAYTDAPVEIVDGATRFQGSGLRYHVREERLRLLEARVVQTP